MCRVLLYFQKFDYRQAKLVNSPRALFPGFGGREKRSGVKVALNIHLADFLQTNPSTFEVI